ncbi:hypothetical protein TEA_001931 [Camellia sinensis var. sinensis]|uniref:4-coumarate--CoA ligase n=1 Tax=Camellia sinensis var. sinensis TaxID=542762 RepID=A0A4S4D472_CAMSN|nr:hypothetical protein TEA_001931 [Camellia sinensis var. sinensis]
MTENDFEMSQNEPKNRLDQAVAGLSTVLDWFGSAETEPGEGTYVNITEKSAVSHSITWRNAVSVKEVEIDGATAFAVSDLGLIVSFVTDITLLSLMLRLGQRAGPAGKNRHFKMGVVSVSNMYQAPAHHGQACPRVEHAMVSMDGDNPPCRQNISDSTRAELIQRYKVTIGPLVPPIVLAIEVVDDYDLSTIRTVMSGAAPLGKELEDAVRSKFPHAKLGQGYGMTEAGPVLAMCLAFAKEPFEIKSGAWDIGYIDDDDELFIVDRLKELIKYKRFQVAPTELEALLFKHPTISDAAVVPMKDESAGEVPVAFVVRTNGFEVTGREGGGLEEISRHV